MGVLGRLVAFWGVLVRLAASWGVLGSLVGPLVLRTEFIVS